MKNHFIKFCSVCICLILLIKANAQTFNESHEFQFSGLNWVEKFSVNETGPGTNYFGLSDKNVLLSNHSKLQLQIMSKVDKHSCAEVYSQQKFGFGLYEFYVEMNCSNLDPSIVLGLFLYNDEIPPFYNEVDIEISKWGFVNASNAQYVIHHDSVKPVIDRFDLPDDKRFMIHRIYYLPESVIFQSYVCKSRLFDKPMLYNEYIANSNPFASNPDVRIRMNLWLSDDVKDGFKKQKAIIHQVTYGPLKIDNNGGYLPKSSVVF
jgi:hypothetical protein